MNNDNKKTPYEPSLSMHFHAGARKHRKFQEHLRQRRRYPGSTTNTTNTAETHDLLGISLDQ